MGKILAAIICSTLWMTSAQAATLWTGPTTSFTKAPFADWTQAANQDRLSPSVWLTRGNTEGLYNISQEAAYDRFGETSPVGTRWAIGTLANGINNLTFTNWLTAVGRAPTSAVGTPYVVHLVADDIYLELTFTQWGQRISGGGSFSYTRSTPAPTATQPRKVPAMPVLAHLLLAAALGVGGRHLVQRLRPKSPA